MIFRFERRISEIAKNHGWELIGVPAAGCACIFAIGVSQIAGRFSDQITLFPPWPVPIAVGVIFGFVKNRKSVSAAAFFVWVLPAIWLLFGLWGQWTSTIREYAWQGWHAMFAHTCEGEDCLGPIFACVPLVFSVAYSTTAAILWGIRRKTRKIHNEPLRTQKLI
jgi:hypothetical protein